ncbi:hypothetical protein EPUS_09254 [Endocarpon pusillum Z07020]|uniref:Uncharacterized protein n=1 Tax=Endocarpon pusillum (strain Z07020 / HMAS-L-300199) TaxID=1263415 RepID=U1GNC7_ENDPU|nr:uncharacterized protein EPUS_09254 [Endocarpon pusillum Z07020]ERF73788.1 hypothetical protein EPUS_09254 [Endocarpon pusillum Z07020]
MSIRVLPINRQPLSLIELTVHRIAVHAQANGWINRPGKRRMRARRWEEKVSWRREADLRSALQGPEAAAQQARRGGQLRGKQRGKKGGLEDKRERTTEGIGEQRALYTQVKRRGGANPDRAGLNRKRQRTRT